jgi:hypothetical protein
MRTRLAGLLALACCGASGLACAACPPEGWTRASLAQLKAANYLVADAGQRQSLAIGLLDCLADPDPALRDGTAIEAISTWLRADALDVPTRTRMLAALEREVQSTDPKEPGVRLPFAALALSEVVRTDRISPWLTAEQHDRLVREATAFERRVSDYRGFEAGVGWRHGVAHGADLLLQLALNPAMSKAQLQLLLDAVASQIAPPGHFYIYGEPERLARPVWAIAKSGALDDAAWQAFFDKLASPAPLASWDEAFATQAGLAKRHDIRGFLLGLLALSDADPALDKFAVRVREGLQKGP